MGTVAKELAVRFCKALIVEGAAMLVVKGIKNRHHGKTFFGKDKKKGIVWLNGEKCYVLGKNEGWVE